jgi:N-sulfoglucosamine sulfohydrolase
MSFKYALRPLFHDHQYLINRNKLVKTIKQQYHSIKKEIMRRLPVILFIILFINQSCSEEKAVKENQPNIIFVIGDDISWDDFGCYGHPTIRTPNIDKMAEEGLRFTNMYLTSSSCSPSRTSIITGRYPHNTGAAELHTSLPEHLTYFPELLKEAGYYTAQAGKWHEGEATLRAYDTLLAGPEINGEGGQAQWLNLLQSRPKDKPFFFWFAPFDAHREWSTEGFREPHDPETEITIPPHLVDTKETREDLAAYYNEIGRIDYHIGELEKELEKQGIADNTIIVFMADNGRPFPGSKTRVYDSGMKTPFIIKWPKGIKNKGKECASLISSIDVAPTLLALSGVETSPTIQGVSFASLLNQPESDFRNYVFAEHNWHDYEAYERMVRTKDYLYLKNSRPKLSNCGPIDSNQSPSHKALEEAKEEGKLTHLQNDVFLTPRPEEEFFNCNKDPLQAYNQINNPEYTAVANHLRQILAQWQQQTGDTQPDVITPDWYHRQTGEEMPAKGVRGEMPGAAKDADKNNSKGPF